MKELITHNYAPSKVLSEIIDDYWSIKNISPQTIELPIVPDGCMDIIYKFQDKEEDILLVGAMDETIITSIASGDYYFGIRFKPSYLSYLLNISMYEFSNKIVSLKSVSKELYLRLDFIQNDEEHRVQNLNSIFEEEFSKAIVDKRVVPCVNKIIKFYEDISVEEVVESAKMSQRQLERLFHYHLGYSIKKFIGIVRFYNAHKIIVENGIHKLSEVAYSTGYYDQSHFNKEHKKYTNFSPSDKNMSILYNTKK